MNHLKRLQSRFQAAILADSREFADHDRFEWTRTTREDHVAGRHPHV